ncbi:hypothetical protein BGW37DRAFT_406540, partial [Umbelopsis sp. PMI_123]
ILQALRTRNPNTIWKKYNELEASDELKSLSTELHALTFRSLKPKNRKAYSTKELEVVKERLFHIYDKMKATGIALDVRDYNHMLKFFGRARDFATCSRIWQELNRATSPNIYSYNLYMYAAVKGGQSSKAFEILDSMRYANVEPNSFTYDTLLKAHGASGDLVKMDNLFADVFVNSKRASGSFLSSIARSKSAKPSTSTFTTLIDAHGATGNIEGLMHIYQNMMPQYNVKCDIKVYNALIRWCCQYGQIATAKKVFFDMESAGIKPNVVTFNYLVRHEALKQGRAGAAYKIMQMMQKIYNVRPLQSMYNAIIKVHIKHRRPEEAKEV